MGAVAGAELEGLPGAPRKPQAKPRGGTGSREMVKGTGRGKVGGDLSSVNQLERFTPRSVAVGVQKRTLPFP